MQKNLGSKVGSSKTGKKMIKKNIGEDGLLVMETVKVCGFFFFFFFFFFPSEVLMLGW